MFLLPPFILVMILLLFYTPNMRVWRIRRIPCGSMSGVVIRGILGLRLMGRIVIMIMSRVRFLCNPRGLVIIIIRFRGITRLF